VRPRLWLPILPLLVAGTQIAASFLDTLAPASYENVELFSRGNASHALIPTVVAVGGLIVAYIAAHALVDVAAAIAERSWALRHVPHRRRTVAVRRARGGALRRTRFIGGRRVTRGPPHSIAA